MCKMIEEMCKEEREEGFLEAIKKLLEKFSPNEIVGMGFSEEDIALAEKLRKSGTNSEGLCL